MNTGAAAKYAAGEGTSKLQLIFQGYLQQNMLRILKWEDRDEWYKT